LGPFKAKENIAAETDLFGYRWLTPVLFLEKEYIKRKIFVAYFLNLFPK